MIIVNMYIKSKATITWERSYGKMVSFEWAVHFSTLSAQFNCRKIFNCRKKFNCRRILNYTSRNEFIKLKKNFNM